MCLYDLSIARQGGKFINVSCVVVDGGVAGLPFRGPAVLVWGSGELAERVRTVVATMSKTTVDQLQEDADGDIGIRAGSAMVFVRVRDNPPLVDVFSPILTEVEPTEQLYVKLSELTNRMPIGRLLNRCRICICRGMGSEAHTRNYTCREKQDSCYL